MNEKIAIVLFSAGLGGTERRIGNLYKFLSQRDPARYYLIINRELYDTLNKANYHLDSFPNIFIVEGKSALDVKTGAHAGILVQFGRLFTLLKYRRILKQFISRNNITTIQVFLEMVPFLGVLPIRNVRMIASLVSHLPKYYDRTNLNSRLLIYALKRYQRVDALYQFIADNIVRLGVPESKVNYPRRNFVNHIQFRPETKAKIVTFTGRMLSYKNPFLLLDAIQKVRYEISIDIKVYILGKGPLLGILQEEVRSRKMDEMIITGFWYDPSEIVNKSMIHVSIEQYDNATNQSLLEGMAAGCAIITSNTGLTSEVVTPDVGLCVGTSSDDIAQALISLYRCPDKITEMGINARNKILAEHNIDMYLDYITGVYERDT